MNFVFVSAVKLSHLLKRPNNNFKLLDSFFVEIEDGHNIYGVIGVNDDDNSIDYGVIALAALCVSTNLFISQGTGHRRQPKGILHQIWLSLLSTNPLWRYFISGKKETSIVYVCALLFKI